MTELLKQWMGDYHMLSDLDRYGYLKEMGQRDEGKDREGMRGWGLRQKEQG